MPCTFLSPEQAGYIKGINLLPQPQLPVGLGQGTYRKGQKMDDLLNLLVQLLIALTCAFIANILVPRQVPGKLFGLVLIGLIGVLLGQWVMNSLLQQYKLTLPWLTWGIQGVPVVPAVIGSAIVLYVVTAFLSWGRYGNR